MNVLNISYEDFEKHLTDIQNLTDFEDGIRELSKKFQDSLVEIYFPTLIENVVQLLQQVTNDTDEWISYWVYDLNCGKEYKDGCITDKDGKNIRLKTIKDLWNMIAE